MIAIRNCLMSLVTIFLLAIQGALGLSHTERLSLLKSKGFQPRVIYDIGAHQGEWTAEISKLFNQSQFFLFEANEYNKSHLDKQRFPYFLTLLGDREEEVTFYVINTTGDSIFREQTHHYKGNKCSEKILSMTRLSEIVPKNSLPLPDLVKMDVQGAEKLIIQGGVDVISNAEVVILEAGILEYNQNAPLFYEMTTLMDGLGYRVLDFVEFHYLPTQELFEIDILFVKKDSYLIKKGMLC